jgi:copper homeostasis protein (lipoprotein)
MNATRFLLVLLASLALPGCKSPATAPDAPAVSAGQSLFAELPASFSGELPCADCEAIRYRLDLFPGGAFFLEMIYLGRGEATFHDIGRWDVPGDGDVLVLHGSREAPVMFSIAGADSLRKRDIHGREISSVLNYTLVRTRSFERIVPRLAMRGMYSHMADAGSFTECSSGQRWPVATEEDNAALERAYLAVRRDPGESLLVSVRGRVELRPAMEGDRRLPTLIVERHIGVWPGGNCATSEGVQ